MSSSHVSLVSFLAIFSFLFYHVSAQLSGSVGPTTSTASKAAKKICNVLNYGAKADQSTDLGPPLTSAFNDCKTGGIVWIPSGNYAMATWVTLNGGSSWALQLDGIIYRTGTAGGNMILIEHATDFEFFSRTSHGAMQGYGYQLQEQGITGPRLVRLQSVTSFSFHDMILVDAPVFHLVCDTCTNGEIYNTIIRGGNKGGLDGIDVWGSNVHVHDVEVTNKDECVTVKSPASNMLIEDIYCNWSGGCAMGSLGADTAISNIEYSNIYTWQSNQMYMIKSNGGSGTVQNCKFTNFIGHSNAYCLDINEYWTDETQAAGNGVVLSGLTFQNWQGTVVSTSRAPINIDCSSTAVCTGLTLSNLSFWSDANTAVHYSRANAYGSGYGLPSGSGPAYSAVVSSVSSAPSGYNGPKMASDLPAGLGLTVSIPIPSTIPTSFFPGARPASALMNGAGPGASSGAAAASPTTTLRTTTASATPTGGSGSGSGSACAALYGQCGGTGFTGPTCCASGTCTVSNQYYSQCL